jgi:hypothetical protein
MSLSRKRLRRKQSVIVNDIFLHDRNNCCRSAAPCQDYAEVVLEMYLAFNHQIVEVECKPLDTGV